MSLHPHGSTSAHPGAAPGGRDSGGGDEVTLHQQVGGQRGPKRGSGGRAGNRKIFKPTTSTHTYTHTTSPNPNPTTPATPKTPQPHLRWRR